MWLVSSVYAMSYGQIKRPLGHRQECGFG